MPRGWTFWECARSHAARVRIFNRTSEFDFAGHPMVGTAYVLADRARDGRLAFEVRAGVVNVELRQDATGEVRGAAITAPRALEIGADHAAELVAACLQIPVEDVLTEHHQPVEASMGNAFVVVEVKPNASPGRPQMRLPSAVRTLPGPVSAGWLSSPTRATARTSAAACSAR